LAAIIPVAFGRISCPGQKRGIAAVCATDPTQAIIAMLRLPYRNLEGAGDDRAASVIDEL